MRSFGPATASATRATKDTVAVTVQMTDGTVIGGELYVFKTGQRLQDLLNDQARQFLPLRTNAGALTFINRAYLKMITEDQA
jgi:hypothetical protein